jgi:hypothetical protein
VLAVVLLGGGIVVVGGVVLGGGVVELGGGVVELDGGVVVVRAAVFQPGGGVLLLDAAWGFAAASSAVESVVGVARVGVAPVGVARVGVAGFGEATGALAFACCGPMKSSTIRGGLLRIISFTRRPPRLSRMCAIDPPEPRGVTSTPSIMAFEVLISWGVAVASSETTSSEIPGAGVCRCSLYPAGASSSNTTRVYSAWRPTRTSTTVADHAGTAAQSAIEMATHRAGPRSAVHLPVPGHGGLPAAASRAPPKRV